MTQKVDAIYSGGVLKPTGECLFGTTSVSASSSKRSTSQKAIARPRSRV